MMGGSFRIGARRRMVGAACLGLFVAAALSACGGGSGAKAEAGAPDKVTLTVSHWPTTGYSATYMVGMQKGFFKQEDIDLQTPVPGSGGGDTARKITAGDLDFGDIAPSALLQASTAGAPLVGIGTSSGSIADFAWVAKKDSPFNSIKDFCGKGTWGITAPGSNSQAITALMAKAAGIDASCVKTVPTGDLAAGLALVRSGQVDASILTEPLVTTEMAKGDLKVVGDPSELLPDYPQVITVTSQQLIKNNPGLVRRFMQALAKSQQYIRQNPKDAGAIFAKGAGLDEKTGVAVITKLAANDKYFTQALSVEGLTNTVEGMKVLGLYKGEPIPWNMIIDQKFLPASARIDVSKLPGYKG